MSPKNEESPKTCLVIQSSSDEEPMPKKASKKKKIKADEDSPVKDIQKKSAKTNPSSRLYEKISKVDTQSDFVEVDPESYFGAPDSNFSVHPKSEKQKRKRDKVSEFVVNDSESILSDEAESAKKKKISNKLQAPSTPQSEQKSQDTRPKFIQALQREPPKLLGTRPLPVGAKNCLEGLTFVITGILEYFDRDEATLLVQRYGGRVTKALSRKTTHLVVGREPGENEEAFYQLISCTNTKDQPASSSIIKEKSHLEQKKSRPIIPKKPSKGKENKLWVDKYKPKTLSNIIGQQGPKSPANKLLKWLQDWSNNRRTKSKKNYFAGKEDGSVFKAALLSGSPGIGKTTTAVLASRQLGFDIVELNASDARSKKCLDAFLSVSIQNFRISDEARQNKSVLIMDEVDGMSGNEDRGGLQELIKLIKASQVPVICICNDRNHPKIRSLANYCFDLRFFKPRVEQLKAHILEIASKEGLDIEVQAVEQIIQMSHNDIRLIVNNLQMWSASNRSWNFDEARKEAKSCEKDTKENIFETARKLFTQSSTSKMSINEILELFFVDYSLMPLFSQENYLVSAAPETGRQLLINLTKAANCISLGAMSENIIRSSNNWSLLPTQGILSCVLPSEYMSGALLGPVRFPQWLGKYSTQNKNLRIIQELVHHTRLSLQTTKSAFLLDYLPYLNNFLYTPFIESEVEGVDEVVSMMQKLHLTRDDWDSIVEMFQWTSLKLQAIPTKVKSTFTRIFNKIDHKRPYSLSARTKKTKSVEQEKTSDYEESEDEKESNPMVTVVSTPVPKTTKTRATRKAKT